MTYTNGETQDFRSDYPTNIMLNVAANKEPCVLHVTFPTVLKTQLKQGTDYDRWVQGTYYLLAHWWKMLKADPAVTVLVDLRPAGSETSMQPITFDDKDAGGVEKTWEIYIVFSGSPSIPSGKRTMDLSGTLIGKQSAAIQVVMNQVWTLFKVYAKPILPVSPEIFEVVGRKAAESPYALNFNWTPGITGTWSFTWPTGIVTTIDTSVILQYWTLTGTHTFTLWKTVRATLAGSTTTVIQTIATSRPTGGTTVGATNLLDSLLNWFKTSFGEYWWIALILFAVAVLLLLKWLFGGSSGKVTIIR